MGFERAKVPLHDHSTGESSSGSIEARIPLLSQHDKDSQGVLQRHMRKLGGSGVDDRDVSWSGAPVRTSRGGCLGSSRAESTRPEPVFVFDPRQPRD